MEEEDPGHDINNDIAAGANTQSDTETSIETDIFLWANQLIPVKEEISIELFLFNKNNVVYRTTRSKELELQMHDLLIDPLLAAVLDGADEGMTVHYFEDAQADLNVLLKTRLQKVDKLRELLNWLKFQERDIEPFVEEEHDFKRLKGVIARVNHATFAQPFYVIKALPQSNLMKANAGWLLRNGKFVKFDAEGALRLPGDNQLLLIENDLYVFNQAKLEQLFNYNAKKLSIAEQKSAAIEQHFKLSLVDGHTLHSMVKDKRPLVNKLQQIEPDKISQDELLSHAEELGVELMTDTDGAIIIMENRDLTKFINLLNDDYMESALTGVRYEIKSKRPLRPGEGEASPGSELRSEPYAQANRPKKLNGEV